MTRIFKMHDCRWIASAQLLGYQQVRQAKFSLHFSIVNPEQSPLLCINDGFEVFDRYFLLILNSPDDWLTTAGDERGNGARDRGQ
ncbi:hypothetical protein [Defluviicoccus vanus]|uniref:Uncharacterized protein n=1 Tax=Defluviicoccus vanus TaxID=111831 RepID=A0A7H1N0M3_9PROT|nr:hypothetical protein [Defluviicoccus vanus]QNT69259.1 hypothetical protein HQ394_07855 [Defluviicoccus vanus]